MIFVHVRQGSTHENRPPAPYAMLDFMSFALYDRNAENKTARMRFSVNTFRVVFLAFFWCHLTKLWSRHFRLALFAQHCFGGAGGKLNVCLNFKILNNFKYHLSEGA